jgi:Uma2 family endonuclease
MPTLIPDPPPPELLALFEQRRRSGLDRLDEVWDGVLHMVPAPSGRHADISHQLAVLLDRPARDAGLFPTIAEFNLGEDAHDFRVPDGGIHRERLTGVWHHTAALVVEITSPGDETRAKLPFYAAHDVDEILIVDPDARTVEWLALSAAEYFPTKRSALMQLGPAELAQQLDWPDA